MVTARSTSRRTGAGTGRAASRRAVRTARTGVKVPLPAQQSGAISVLFAAPAGLSRVPFMFFGGLEFENIPVR